LADGADKTQKHFPLSFFYFTPFLHLHLILVICICIWPHLEEKHGCSRFAEKPNLSANQKELFIKKNKKTKSGTALGFLRTPQSKEAAA
jgi:hypothetical protein